MNKYLQQLVNLSQIDQKIDNYAPQIESINRNLQLKKDEIAAIDENIEKTDNEISELKTQISNTNSHINEFNAKIKDISKKTSAVKSEKEIKALNLEEDLAKDQLEAANEEINRLERIIDSKNLLKFLLITKLVSGLLSSNTKTLSMSVSHTNRESVYSFYILFFNIPSSLFRSLSDKWTLDCLCSTIWQNILQLIL